MRKGFESSFYVANGMEIFERLAWYGFFTLSSLYMTTPIAQGGVGFTDAERGALQGIIPFFLYLLPVVTGALADRYGYKKMFLISFVIMAPSYYLLGQATSFGSFFVAFMLVAIGAACFKPVVVGTVSLTTNDKNRGLGFGIFYTMVNVGGFLGPLVAGYMRAISWDMVFIMSSAWILINFLPAIFLFKEPTNPERKKESVKQVLLGAQQVLGNLRLALLVFPAIVLLMAAGAKWMAYTDAFAGIFIWFIANLLWDSAVKKKANPNKWYLEKVRVSNKPFAAYLLLLTGFWAVYNQLFYTMPLYIRDFVDTHDLVVWLSYLGESWVEFFAAVNSQAINELLTSVQGTAITSKELFEQLLHLKLRVPESDISHFLSGVNSISVEVTTASWIEQYRQINPEYIINLDFAAIVLCQVMVSLICQRFKTIYVLTTGVIIFAVGTLLAIWAEQTELGGAIVVTVVLMMAFGEMVTSPKSQEYVASIAPKNQAAMYMGYYFISMALGFLFAGLLSGWGYGELAKAMGRPDLMWFVFSVIGSLTAIGLMLFNIFYLSKQTPVITDAIEA